MNTKRIITLLLICAASLGLKATAATVDTALTHSASMNKDLKAVVIKPTDYSTHRKNTR
jgi:hypothetical protein